MKELSSEQINSFIAELPAAKRDEFMAAHTYLKIGGPARLFLIATSEEEMLEAVQVAKKERIPFYVCGGGSNLLAADEGYEGLVIQAANRSMSFEGAKVTAAAGVFTGLLARSAADKGLAGFEWGATLPGTLGGAIYGNAGCFGGEMEDVVQAVECYDLTAGGKRIYQNAECGFGYRDSRFKREPHLILSCTLRLKEDDPASIRSRIDGITSKRKESQPLGTSSAGCLFKNYEFKDEGELEILKRSYEIPKGMLERKRLGAGWLIDKAGLKGKTIGKAQVSPVHGNFILNLGGARAQDIIALSSLLKMKVRDKFGILLEDEVQYLI